MAFMPSLKWHKLKHVLNERYNGRHWERQATRPMRGETKDQYMMRQQKLDTEVLISNGIPTIVLLGRGAEIVHIAKTWQLEILLRHAVIKARHGDLPKWDWVAISQGGDVEMRKYKWKARIGQTTIFKGTGKRHTQVRVAVYAAEIQEQKRQEKMAEEKARLEAYNKKFRETLAAGDLPEAPDWQ